MKLSRFELSDVLDEEEVDVRRGGKKFKKVKTFNQPRSRRDKTVRKQRQQARAFRHGELEQFSRGDDDPN